MLPTIFDNVDPAMEIYRSEVFGPVLTITPFDSEEEAVKLANDTQLGLSSGLWTSDFSRAHRMVGKIRAGVVHVNTYGGSDGTVPLAGVKQSGNGLDKSLHALEKYSNVKSVWMKI